MDEARTADAREQLAQSLAKAAPQDRRVVARLTELLTDKYPQLRAASAVKLAVVHDVPPETLQALAGLLADEETDGVTGERVAQLAARSLIDIGGPAVVAAPQIAAHLEHREARVRRRAADVLAAIGLPEAEDEARPVESKLAALLVDQNDAVRFAAAGALVRHRAMDAAWADLATAALLDEWVTDRAQRWVHAIPHSIFRHEPMPPMEMTHGGRVASYGLPRFPWPPPRPTHRDVIPRQFLGDDQSTLEQVHRRIKQALELVDSSFEYGLFEMAPHADGFTLLARLERIKPDGTPYSQPNRFPTKGGVFPLSLAEYLKQLFMATAGNFRLIAFVITDRQINDWSGQAVPDPGAGTIDLPPELGSKPFKGMYSYALVYVFEKRPGGQPRLLYQTPLNARVHLERAGVWAVLSAP